METDRFYFRVWDDELKEYSYRIDLLDLTSDTRDIFDSMYMNHEYGNGYMLEEKIKLEQCTGLKDKNGNLIFEGDYLEIRNPSGTVHMRVEVFFSKGSFMIGAPDKQNNYLRILEDEGWEYQTIGNINENPEKLEQ